MPSPNTAGQAVRQFSHCHWQEDPGLRSVEFSGILTIAWRCLLTPAATAQLKTGLTRLASLVLIAMWQCTAIQLEGLETCFGARGCFQHQGPVWTGASVATDWPVLSLGRPPRRAMTNWRRLRPCASPAS